MPELKNYHIMISHSWDYNEHYEKVKGWLDDAPYFTWTNYSVPYTNPIDAKGKKELQEKLTNRISNCSCVIILSGMYVAYSEWIDFEMDTALRMGKPIIGVEPWGQERVPQKITENAITVVGWNSKSVVDAVRNYAL